MPEVQSELQVLLSGPVVEDGVDEGHDCCFEIDIVSVLASTPIQVIYDTLERKII